MPLSSAERTARYRALRKDLGVADTTRRNRRAEKARWKAGASLRRPFCGCDGEGAGSDEQGRQNYLLFRAGDRELYTGSHLKTAEILGFICDHPAKDIMVGFAFGYDVTMILRDLSEAQRERLFQPLVFSEGHSPYVWFKEFDIQYLPRNYLKVRRVKIERTADGKERRIPIKGSQRTIYETFGFFQKSFLKCLYEFDIGTADQRETIARSKDRRGADDWSISQEERAYCDLECQFLAELMEKLRANCYAAGIRPHTWSGAGKLAAALHKKHDTPTGAVAMEHVPPEVIDLAQMAYYGGRFEITRTGFIDQEVWEYDIQSAYPAAMSNLPCLMHGRWECFGPGDNVLSDKDLYVAAVSFSHGPNGLGCLYGLPIRSKEGHLYWPRQGNGIYWSCEIRSAEALGARCKISHGWRYIKSCDCKMFDWVEELFEYRKSIGKQGPGYPIKLGINSWPP